jgi:hypothetical protein
VSTKKTLAAHRELEAMAAREPRPSPRPEAAQAAGPSMEPVACGHETRARWDHVYCVRCGSVMPGAHEEWGIAKNRWFSSLDEATFYRDHGRLPSVYPAPVAAISAGDVAETRVTPEMLADAFQMDRVGGRYYLTEYGQDASNGPMRGVVFYDAAAIKDVAALLTAALRRCTCCPGSDVCAARQRSNT